MQIGKGRSAGLRCVPLIAGHAISIISSGLNKARIIQILNRFSRVSWWWGTTLTKTLVTRNVVQLYCESLRKSRKPCMRMAKPESYSSNEAYSICSGTLKEERPARVSVSRTLQLGLSIDQPMTMIWLQQDSHTNFLKNKTEWRRTATSCNDTQHIATYLRKGWKQSHELHKISET